MSERSRLNRSRRTSRSPAGRLCRSNFPQLRIAAPSKSHWNRSRLTAPPPISRRASSTSPTAGSSPTPVATKARSGIAGVRPILQRSSLASQWTFRSRCIPISSIVRAGDRIRLTIAAADADNLVVPTQGDEATLTVTIGGERAARLILPIVNESVIPTAQVVEGGFDGGPGGFAFRRPVDPAMG